jgi:glycerophosphoryl diester phosphodiesterase family protein
MTGSGEGGDWALPGASVPPPGWSADQPPPAYPPPPPPPGWAQPPPGWAQPSPAGGWTAYGPPPVPRVGIVPLRPLSVGEILDGAFTAIRRYPRAVLGLSAATAAVQQLLILLVDLSTGGFAAPTATGLSNLGTVSGVVTAVLNAVLATLIVGMLTLVIGDAVIGRKAPLPVVWARLRPQWWRLLLAAFLAAVLPWLGLVALIVGGVLLWVALSFTTPALVLERLTVRQALRRSWRLTMRSFWRVFGILLLAWLIAGVLRTILAIPGALIAFVLSAHSLSDGDIGVAAEVAIRLASFLANAITLPFIAGVTALLYIDCRMRTEALDVTLARAAAENPPA